MSRIPFLRSDVHHESSGMVSTEHQVLQSVHCSRNWWRYSMTVCSCQCNRFVWFRELKQKRDAVCFLVPRSLFSLHHSGNRCHLISFVHIHHLSKHSSHAFRIHKRTLTPWAILESFRRLSARNRVIYPASLNQSQKNPTPANLVWMPE